MPKKPDKRQTEHIAAQSPDLRADLRERLRALAPEAFAEGRLDADKLKALLGEAADTGPERYSFSWNGKRDAIAMLQLPTRATLVPDRGNSVNFDEAQHAFIEGENLEVLKVLYRSYFGRVKMIYIDPPYNTGNDFIYPDDFADPLDHYLRITGQKNGNGDYTTSQVDRGGRVHSAWLSMMYPRLSFARQLLCDDGVILISIDDHEAANLRKLADDVLGEENFIAQLVWEKGRKNDAKLFSVGHEYVVIYAKSLGFIKEKQTVWREEKPGAKEIWDEYVRLRSLHRKDDKAIEADLTDWFRDLPKSHPSKKWARYRRIDANGPWRDRDISWPGGDGPTYDVPHPKTGLPCKVPEAGWRFSTAEEMQRQIKLGLVEFRDDHTEPPFRKAHIRPIPEELDDATEVEDDELADDENIQEDEVILSEFVVRVLADRNRRQRRAAKINLKDCDVEAIRSKIGSIGNLQPTRRRRLAASLFGQVRRLGGRDLLNGHPFNHVPGGDEDPIADMERRANSLVPLGIDDRDERDGARRTYIGLVEGALFSHQKTISRFAIGCITSVDRDR